MDRMESMCWFNSVKQHRKAKRDSESLRRLAIEVAALSAIINEGVMDFPVPDC